MATRTSDRNTATKRAAIYARVPQQNQTVELGLG